MLRKRVSRIDITPTSLFRMSTEALTTVESGPLLSKKAVVVPTTHPCRRSMRVFLYPFRRASSADGPDDGMPSRGLVQLGVSPP
ncbi:hypothetical protein XAC3810_530219 [Xanthomonas citri pv. citri]|nr:hypothetical protein XAC1083_530195 [Xanthomonas citri pv. citri]CEE43484.1 hypothetical protein XAC3810_530219 [Xanthomonas citri pv. citri]CEE70469.1 hypothetical protein XACW160_510220 [Xanthomonas citri pv. citri]CEE76277.1 hypothetical protein XAC2852_580223 [Xanthomonas citri pv. citri]CEE83375.1 hypothetical protein XACLC80_670071 [Xanthomonas citri pv. citri]